MSTVLLPFYQSHLKTSSSHLDIGPGSGYMTAQAATVPLLSKLKRFAFLDASNVCLQFSTDRAVAAGYRGPQVELYHQSIFDAVPEETKGGFDTVALFWVFHCLPGAFPSKASQVVETILPTLAKTSTSTFYGATILGRGVRHTWFGNHLQAFFRGRSIFSNEGDDAEGLRAGLEPYFDEVKVEVVGTNALFTCRGPKARVS
jgi:hypothetical protein